MLSPRPRANSRSAIPNKQPCGNTEKSKVHYLAAPNSRNLIQWRTIRPDPHGNCTVRMGTGIDESQFRVLRPRDGSGDNAYGKFPCGRVAGYEGKEFRFLNDTDCDGCVLQLEWETSLGQLHQCADVAVEHISTGSNPSSCAGLCENGGVCANQVCQCPKGYSGDHCQYQGKNFIP